MLGKLGRREFLRVYGGMASAPMEQMVEAVAYGLRSVTGFEVDGSEVSVERVSSDGCKRADAKTLDALFDPILFGELGSRILEVSQLDPTRGQD